ncbi:hypothetical protein [Nocardioides sp. YIM 152315]|uniref:hypothetical protein n=1 Tax=Nocardioides sp. YIM 152315 TaxID=3031760 RepID=UPI0023DCC61F|nr:hypothetical protein [Nocardioides sp. YIM 152315]MDF1603451.1 hypothetical protein [Nocardioides sp. YIM 152315]
MDALDVMKVCLRRWYVMMAVILIAAGAGAGLVRDQAPVFRASGNYALVYTHGEDVLPNQADPRSANPLGGDNAALLAEALADELRSPTQQRARASAGTQGYAPGDPADGSSFVAARPEWSKAYVVQAWGPSPDAVRDVVSDVLESTPMIAQQIQDRAGAPRSSQWTTFTTAPVQVSALPPSSKMKLLIAIAGIGLLAGAALSILFDRLMSRRRARLAARQQADDVDDAVATPDAGSHVPSVGPGAVNRQGRPLHEVHPDEDEQDARQDARRSRELRRVR